MIAILCNLWFYLLSTLVVSLRRPSNNKTVTDVVAGMHGRQSGHHPKLMQKKSSDCLLPPFLTKEQGKKEK